MDLASGSRLIFPSESVEAFQAHRKTIRSELRDTYNRLHSISEDATFVLNQVKPAFPDFPIIPNQRAGAWYVEPVPGKITPHAYFKSTDGHAGQHDFNLRRTNLSLLSTIKERKGIILVDSTRRGKRFPDALSKTVPTWCAVLNLARCILLPPSDDNSKVSAEDWERDGALWTLSSTISRSEHSQIENRIREWAEKLVKSSYDLSTLLTLDRPLRPIFISPSSRFSSEPSRAESFQHIHPIICVSASKLASEQDGLERALGFTYVQGSGDDHESWSRGLTPLVFWKYSEKILGSSREQVDEVIDGLLLLILEKEEKCLDVKGLKIDDSEEGLGMESSIDWIRKTGLGLGFGIVETSSVFSIPIVRIIASRSISEASPTTETTQSESKPNLIIIRARTGKVGYAPYFAWAKLQSALDLAKEELSMSGGKMGIQVVTSPQQSEANDLGLALALIVLVKFFNDDGLFEIRSKKPTKDDVRSRLAWILQTFPTTNPSRAVLQKVNEFLMSSTTRT